MIPERGPRRALAAWNFVFTVGTGHYLTAGTPAWAAAALLPTAAVIHTVGELWHSARGFEVSFAPAFAAAE